MGILSKLLTAGAAALTVGVVAKSISKSKEQREEEERRINTVCIYNDNLSENEFEEIVMNASKKIKRIKDVYIINAKIKCNLSSQTGLSKWSFSVDFNDYGKITGKYWEKTDNEDSLIPKHFAETIKEEVLKKIHS